MIIVTSITNRANVLSLLNNDWRRSNVQSVVVRPPGKSVEDTISYSVYLNR